MTLALVLTAAAGILGFLLWRWARSPPYPEGFCDFTSDGYPP